MKPLLFLLALSLAANAALLVKRSRATASAEPPGVVSTAARPVEAERGNNTANAPLAASESAPPAGLTVSQSKHRLFWERLQAGDVSAVDELRAAGWPPSAIRVLVRSLIETAARDRMKTLQPDSKKDEYWTARSMMGNMSPEQQKAARELWRDQTALMKKLLGSDYTGLYEEQSWRDRRFASLTPAQAEAVRAIEEDYSFLLQDVRSDFTGTGPSLLLPEDREKIAFLEKEKQADLARTLSPQELLDYELRSSSIASSLRYELDAFNPSEDEFRTIFSLTKNTAQQLNYIQPSGVWTQQDQENRQKIQAEVEAQVKQLLGEQRFAEYSRAKDYEYRRLYQLAQRLELPVSAANAAYEVKADIEKRVREFRKEAKNQDPESVAALRQATLDEAEQRLMAALGPRAFDVYVANNGFIVNLRRSLAPPAPRPSPAPGAGSTSSSSVR
jgi:hypothetical protein